MADDTNPSQWSQLAHTIRKKIQHCETIKQIKTVLRYQVALGTPQDLETQAPQVGPSFLGVKMEKPVITQPRQEIKHM